ncbi:unnamed protein product [Cyprideis torosa]|uniref:Uncharacterized protein n=1 Tax=Cyprideis torosa TaxID=163714 RepID=A0A7R8ZMD3_9CRUS|nr:unnamed protein product [Cyprideis torosa]CAG0893936.1 unnamed protein product [Cyprideis torosa]
MLSQRRERCGRRRSVSLGNRQESLELTPPEKAPRSCPMGWLVFLPLRKPYCSGGRRCSISVYILRWISEAPELCDLEVFGLWLLVQRRQMVYCTTCLLQNLYSMVGEGAASRIAETMFVAALSSFPFLKSVSASIK